jgi:hypothetical protein
LHELHGFNRSYKGLLGGGDDQTGEDTDGSGDLVEKFNKRYGWMYSTKQVAEFERITVDQTYQLGVVHVMNVLSYLKAKEANDKELIRSIIK